MLCEPARTDEAEFSKADVLVRLCLKSRSRVLPRSGPTRLGIGSGRSALGELPASFPHLSSFLVANLLRGHRRVVPARRRCAPALELFEARALFDGEERAIHLRVAEHDGKLYLDLCDPDWRAVEIDADGWRVIDRAPAKISSLHAAPRPLPRPEPGGSIEELRPFPQCRLRRLDPDQGASWLRRSDPPYPTLSLWPRESKAPASRPPAG